MSTTDDQGKLNVKFENIKKLMKDFGIEVTDIKKKSGTHYSLTTSHKKAGFYSGTNCDILNLDFLTFTDCKIETKYPVNEVIQKIIDYGNQYVDFFEALRIQDLLTNKLYNYATAVKAYIDFELNLEDPSQNEIVLTFEHNKSSMCHLISNTDTITSGTHQSMHIVFNLAGEMTVNRLNAHRKRTLAVWGDDIKKSFKEYGLLTEMVRI